MNSRKKTIIIITVVIVIALAAGLVWHGSSRQDKEDKSVTTEAKTMPQVESRPKKKVTVTPTPAVSPKAKQDDENNMAAEESELEVSADDVADNVTENSGAQEKTVDKDKTGKSVGESQTIIGPDGDVIVTPDTQTEQSDSADSNSSTSKPNTANGKTENSNTASGNNVNSNTVISGEELPMVPVLD